MNNLTVYDRIEQVIRVAGRPLSEFEFSTVRMDPVHYGYGASPDGRYYIGCSESTLGRRCREMRELGRLKSRRRPGQAYMEYWPSLMFDNY